MIQDAIQIDHLYELDTLECHYLEVEFAHSPGENNESAYL